MSHIVGLNTWGECQLFDYMDYLEANGWFFITRSCSLVGWSSGKLLLCWLKYQASTVLNLKLIHFDLIALPLKCQWATYAKHIFRKDGGSSPEIQSQSWGMRNEKEKKNAGYICKGRVTWVHISVCHSLLISNQTCNCHKVLQNKLW